MLAPAYTGHLNPMGALARALQKRGHRTVLVAPLDAEAHVRQAGLDFIPIAQLELPQGEWERAAAETGALSGLKATRCAVRCLARLAHGIQRELPGIYERERFDVHLPSVVLQSVSSWWIRALMKGPAGSGKPWLPRSLTLSTIFS